MDPGNVIVGAADELEEALHWVLPQNSGTCRFLAQAKIYANIQYDQKLLLDVSTKLFGGDLQCFAPVGISNTYYGNTDICNTYSLSVLIQSEG